MYILTAEQIRQWDAFTIAHKHISSLQLMEDAAMACLNGREANHYLENSFIIFCGRGNNGGDGLALARLLAERNAKVTVYILPGTNAGSDDFEANRSRLPLNELRVVYLHDETTFPPLVKDAIIIDALFGSGLNRPLDGLAAALVEHLNKSNAPVISIDIPSGLFADRSSLGQPVVRASITLTFQVIKMAFLIPENERYIGKPVVLDIGLTNDYLQTIAPNAVLVNHELIRSIYKPRNEFAHKGDFGHAILVAGSLGKMGAAVLSAKACLQAGVGLLTCYLPACGCDIMQISLPEAMVVMDRAEHYISELNIDWSRYKVLGVGPGLGTAEHTKAALGDALKKISYPAVIDADGLNIIASEPALLYQLVPNSILSPHPKEFERLFGKSKNDFDRVKLAREKASELRLIIVLKGHHTFIAMPDGIGYFNSTGNAGMAKGGSGDTLTGILTGLLAQGYRPQDAALFGVYLHGLAGDLAAASKSQEAMLASDISGFLGEAFKALRNGV